MLVHKIVEENFDIKHSSMLICSYRGFYRSLDHALMTKSIVLKVRHYTKLGNLLKTLLLPW